MRIDDAEARRLLRLCRSGALGTHSVAAPGYPFVSLLPYVLDGACRPLFLLSGLAEHSRNLLDDPRSSLLVWSGDGGPLQQARLTVLGKLEPVELDAATQARFLRYSPESADYLALGDFRFFRLEPERLRLIAGFGRMGWGDAPRLQYEITAADELAMLGRLERRAPIGVTLLGVDCEGVDTRIAGVFRRWAFDPPQPEDCDVEAAVGLVLDEMADRLGSPPDDLA